MRKKKSKKKKGGDVGVSCVWMDKCLQRRKARTHAAQCQRLSALPKLCLSIHRNLVQFESKKY